MSTTKSLNRGRSKFKDINKGTKAILFTLLSLIIIFVVLKFTIFSSTEVVLKMIPVDQQDLQQGFIVSDHNWLFVLDDKLKVGDTIWMLLDVGPRTYFGPETVWTEKPKRQGTLKKAIFIKGTVADIKTEIEQPAEEPSNDPEDLWGNAEPREFVSSLIVRYGFEDEFKIKVLEQKIDLANQEVMAKIKVDKDGNSTLKEIYVSN